MKTFVTSAPPSQVHSASLKPLVGPLHKLAHKLPSLADELLIIEVLEPNGQGVLLAVAAILVLPQRVAIPTNVLIRGIIRDVDVVLVVNEGEVTSVAALRKVALGPQVVIWEQMVLVQGLLRARRTGKQQLRKRGRAEQRLGPSTT